mgnify:FL=1
MTLKGFAKGGNLTKHEIDMVSKILYLTCSASHDPAGRPMGVTFLAEKGKQLEHNTTQFLFGILSFLEFLLLEVVVNFFFPVQFKPYKKVWQTFKLELISRLECINA